MNGNRPADPLIKKLIFWFVIVPFIALFSLLIYAAIASTQDFEGGGREPHPLDWIAKYRGKLPPGMGCCGHQDCVPVNMRIAAINGDKYDIEFFYKNGQGPFVIKDFPAKATYVSEDENDYFCFVPFYHGSIGMPPPSGDPCVKDPLLECANCFFYSPKT